VVAFGVVAVETTTAVALAVGAPVVSFASAWLGRRPAA